MEKSLPEAGDAAKIVKLVNEAINKTRELARGLLPVVSDAHGLMSALQQWAGEVEDLFGVSCRFQCFTPVLIHDDTVAYWPGITRIWFRPLVAVSRRGQTWTLVSDLIAAIAVTSSPKASPVRHQPMSTR